VRDVVDLVILTRPQGGSNYVHGASARSVLLTRLVLHTTFLVTSVGINNIFVSLLNEPVLLARSILVLVFHTPSLGMDQSARFGINIFVTVHTTPIFMWDVVGQVILTLPRGGSSYVRKAHATRSFVAPMLSLNFCVGCN